MPLIQVSEDEKQTIDHVRKVDWGKFEIEKARGKIVMVSKLREDFKIN